MVTRTWLILFDRQEKQADAEDVAVCREALELLTVCLALHPQTIETLNKDKAWQNFIIDILILCRSRCVNMSWHSI